MVLMAYCKQQIVQLYFKRRMVRECGPGSHCRRVLGALTDGVGNSTETQGIWNDFSPTRLSCSTVKCVMQFKT